jgi:hypothetical protein|nr:MAG TPA: DNA REPAIR HELICASE RAD25, SSL2, PRE-INITIATION COMPLEX, RNA POLYMERASE.0A [Crassvirales sp.]
MTREEAKELLPIIQAFAEGKTIQVKGPDNRWYDYEGKNCKLKFDSRVQDYCIKPKYRPFKNAEECWQEMQKHNPFGWIKVKNSNCYKFLAAVQNIGIYSVGRCTYETGFKNFTFTDGAPFGIKVG